VTVFLQLRIGSDIFTTSFLNFNVSKLCILCGENEIVKFCKLSRLRWAGHVISQDDDDLSRRVLLSEPGAKHLRGRPRLRWEDGVV
jgi:hypothetical protein